MRSRSVSTEAAPVDMTVLTPCLLVVGFPTQVDTVFPKLLTEPEFESREGAGTGRLLPGSPIEAPVPWVALVPPLGGPVADLGTVVLGCLTPNFVLDFLRLPTLPLDNSAQCSAERPIQ